MLYESLWMNNMKISIDYAIQMTTKLQERAEGIDQMYANWNPEIQGPRRSIRIHSPCILSSTDDETQHTVVQSDFIRHLNP